MSFWVYILRCADGSFYTGHTDNLEQRINQHHAGTFPTCYTFKRRPLQVAFSQDFATREEALTAEQQIKGWSRKKKEAMVRGDWAEVSRLAKLKSPALSIHPAHPEPVEGPESVDGPKPAEASGPPRSVHGSTSSPRTVGEVFR